MNSKPSIRPGERSFKIRPVNTEDYDWVTTLLQARWGSVRIVTRGKVHHADKLPGFIAERGGERVGLITYEMDGEECEIVSLDSLMEGQGVGSALLSAVKDQAKQVGCKRLWLITTNDNTTALRFYQKMGFQLVAVHRNAIERSRALKPEIPTIGQDGIPIRDEVELEISFCKEAGEVNCT